ncbi:MAG: heparinase II/III family protein [Rhizobiaceae bacterium]
MASIVSNQPRKIALATAGIWRRLSRRLQHGPLARWRFIGPTPDRIVLAPPDLRMADAHLAAEFYAGRYALGGKTVETDGLSPFDMEPPNADWMAALHNFRWLRHMREAGTDLAAKQARRLVRDWIEKYGGTFEGLAWDADVASQRVIAWLQHSGTLLRDCEIEFYQQFLKSLAVQLRFLKAVTPSLDTGETKLRCRIALVFAALSLPVSQARLSRATQKLEDELKLQILADGVHISRNPETVLELLTDLLPLRQTYANQSENPPTILIATIERMVPALRFFRHRDGALANFNGAGYAMQERMAAVLRYDDTGGKPLSVSPHSGYQRLAMGSVTVIADTGVPPPIGASEEANAGCLSFELSSGRHRYVVNCGTDRFGPSDLRLISRTTAAHSTATMNDTSSCQFAATSSATSLYGTPIVAGPRKVSVKRLDEDDAQGFIASHDGYLRNFQAMHSREMRMSHGGSVIAGMDKFGGSDNYPLRNAKKDLVTIRFHLHPNVAVTFNDEAQITLSAERDDTWVFTCNEVAPMIAESVFFAGISGPQRTKMIVLEFHASEVDMVNWQFTRTGLGNWSR